MPTRSPFEVAHVRVPPCYGPSINACTTLTGAVGHDAAGHGHLVSSYSTTFPSWGSALGVSWRRRAAVDGTY